MNETGSTNQTHEPICSKCGEECIVIVVEIVYLPSSTVTVTGPVTYRAESQCCRVPVIVVQA